MKDTMKKYYILGILVAFTFIVGSVVVFSPSSNTTTPSQKNTQNSEISISLSIDGLYEAKTVTAHSDETALSLLQRLNIDDPRLALRVKEYSGLGALVENIGELHNGTDNKYWQYTVNGVMPQIGTDKFTLSSGDHIKWSFTTSSQ